jgi:hypothetical protein
MFEHQELIWKLRRTSVTARPWYCPGHRFLARRDRVWCSLELIAEVQCVLSFGSLGVLGQVRNLFHTI